MATSSAPTACTEQATDKELAARLEKVLVEYQGKPGALIPVLQIAQGIYGYLPQTVIKRIATAVGKSYSEVAGVVGFYSFFSTVPRGKHLVRVCLGTACYVRGGKAVLEALKQELEVDVGGTTEDGVFSLEVARCFGACGLAPTMMIDEDVIQRVKPVRVRAILEGYRTGRPAAGGDGNGNGKVKAAAKSAKKPAARKAAAKKPVAARRATTRGGKK
jgi:NADH:ubiquinone oxidoreductase subunit E